MYSEQDCCFFYHLKVNSLFFSTACLFRYNVLSFVYLIYLLLIPLFPEPTSTTMQGHTGRLLQSLCFTSMSFLLLHIIYQITVNSLLAGNSISSNFSCSPWERSIRQIGFESVIGADAGNGIRVFIPDIGMFMAGLAIWLLCRTLVQKRPPEDMAQYNADFDAEEQDEEEKPSLDDDDDLLEEELEAGYEAEEDEDNEYLYDREEEELEEEEEEEVKESTKRKILRLVAEVASKLKEIIGNLITTAGKVVVTILLGMTGIILPSLTSFVYFSIFLFLCTWWSLCRTFNTLIFSCMCVLMAIYSAGHIIVLYLYQFQFFQESVSPQDEYIRVFGISPIVQSNCSCTWKLSVHSDRKWYHFVSPIMLLVLYYTLATLIRLWLQEPIDHLMVSSADTPAEHQLNVPFLLFGNTCAFITETLNVISDDRQNGPTSNGTSLDFMATENGPPCLNFYSTPQYKMDQPEKKEECVYEVSLPPEDSAAKETEDEENDIKKKGVGAMVKVFHFVMKQSYICALIAMMAWSITYVSWLTFVFLMWSCILWMVRDRRRYAMMSSPFMVAYGNLIIVLQYFWSFERAKPVAGFFVEKKNPFHSLSSKMLCMLSFWLLLRQTLTERQEKQKEESAGLSDVHVEDQKKKGKPYEQDIMHVFGSMVMAVLVKYWIYICGGMFFFVSFEGNIVMYKIIYMMMFLSCVALYQVHFEYWRRILKYFWMSVVIYTMLVLTVVYTFQFDGSKDFWSGMLNVKNESLNDLGLEQFSVSTLFTRIFIPTSFLLVCILHLHYFHDHFLQLTDLQAVIAKEQSTIYRLVDQDGSLPDLTMLSASSVEGVLSEDKPKVFPDQRQSSTDESQHYSAGSEPEPSTEQNLKSKWHLVVDRLTVLFLKFLEYFHKLQLFIWWLLEIHIIKIVSCYIILLTLYEVSLLNFVFLVCWAFALPYSQYRPLASSICTVWTCVIIVCKMLYQLKTINPPPFDCSYVLSEVKESLLYKIPGDPGNWWGLKKTEDLLGYLRNNLLMLALLAFEVTIYRHQLYFRLRNKLSPPAAPIIFHDITRQHLDMGITYFIKYFINYFFYKFGLETCLLLVVNVIGQRMDFYAMLHAFALIAVMYRRRRKAIAEIWSKYCFFLACMLTFQYFVCIGIPPAACKDYPWSFTTDSNVIKWLYIPDFYKKPDPLFLIYDFMLLLCASMQRQVFEDENKAAVRLIAGDNVEICRDLDAASFSVHNPVPDFIHCRSYLDMLKVIMFSYLFWFVLTIIFITGTTRISIFCMGYLVACFYFLLFGGELLLKPIKKILHYWDFLIAYNIFVITMKNILSILACGYIDSLMENNCWLIQLFSLSCTIKGYVIKLDTCDIPKNEAGIIWDSICFAFLLLQRRVFMSYYFLHVVADIRASQVLASRGAELFQATIVKAVKARLEEEHKSVEQLKRQMERIKVRQQKFKRGKDKILSLAQESAEGQPVVQPEEDDDDGMVNPTPTHSVVRSGDYYLFETDSGEEEEEEEKKEEETPKKSAFQFLYQAWITDPKAALKARSKDKRKFWKKYTRRVRQKKNKQKPGHVAIEVGEVCCCTSSADNIIKRVFNIIKFTWVLFQTTVESFTKWMNDMCREYIDISTVLRIERCMLTREVKKGNVPSRESIHVYYKKAMRLNMSRQASLDMLSDDELPSGSTKARKRRGGGYRMESQDSTASRDSMSRYTGAFTEATTLFSRQSTLEDIDGPLERIPKTSERARPTLKKMSRLDTSNSSLDSGSFISRCPCACLLHSPDTLECPVCLGRMFYDEELEQSDHFYQNQPLILQFSYALYNMLVAHSEFVCYLVIIINHMVSASCVSLVLPVTIFLWAMLSVPRPSKRYWMTAIVYTEVTIVIKYFCQFGFFPHSKNYRLYKNAPYYPANIIGVEKKDGYVLYDLVQLLALFFHRSILKCHGLWDEDDPKERKEAARQSESEYEEKEKSVREKERSSTNTMKSFNSGTSMESETFQVHCQQQHTYQRRKSSSGGSHVSYRSHPSSASTTSHNSSHKEGSQASVHQKTRKQMILEKLREQLFKAKAFTIKRFLEIYLPMKQFFYNLIHPEYSAVTDVYVLMFLADTVDFIIIVFGFWAFGKHSTADITSSLSEDQVPGPFLVMVLIQFGTMVVDRALYLRKTVLGKVIFQVLLVFGIHFWMFFILPIITEKRFNENTVAQMWYFVKCIYFGLSAYQIRCGYPTRVLGNFLTKSYNYVNLFLFQGFRLVPFLTELRAVMDWVWTDTSLSLSSWICVEDIYAHIFILKCWRESEKRYPQPRGQKKKKVVKYGMGGMIVVLLICIVWFPLLFMSLVKSVAGVVNAPLDVSVTITLAGFQPIFTMSAQQKQLWNVTKTAIQWLENYTPEDLIIAELKGSSNSLWTISPPSRDNLIDMLRSQEEFSITVSWSIQRNLSLGAEAESAYGKNVMVLNQETKQNLILLLNGAADAANTQVIFLTGNKMIDIHLTMQRAQNDSGQAQEWWIVNQTEQSIIPKIGRKHEAGLEIYVFSDQVSPPSLGFLAGYGIMGLYASVVLVIGKFVREFFSGISHKIMFEELPNVDRILKLCTDIFLVRETGELDLEEDMYSKLIFLYRSPETMIKWTREKTQ
uniref:Piezo type mechanosensitive ion channel component 2 n=1 Tax=Oryzias latipes TaxID=8090 RepID=H2LFT8_ORYLA